MTQTSILDMQAEMKRRKSKRDDLLAAFIREGELNTGEIMQIAGTGMSSRLKELKRKGHIIVSNQIQSGLWKYTYLGQRDTDDTTRVDTVD